MCVHVCALVDRASVLILQVMSEDGSDYPNYGDDDDDDYGGGDDDEQEDKELLIECGQRQVGSGFSKILQRPGNPTIMHADAPAVVSYAVAIMQATAGGDVPAQLRYVLFASCFTPSSHIHHVLCCLAYDLYSRPVVATMLQGRWARHEEELEKAAGSAQVLSMEQGKAIKRQIFSRCAAPQRKSSCVCAGAVCQACMVGAVCQACMVWHAWLVALAGSLGLAAALQRYRCICTCTAVWPAESGMTFVDGCSASNVSHMLTAVNPLRHGAIASHWLTN
jgi:hypothetical protein